MKLRTALLMSTIFGAAAGVALAYVSVGPAARLASPTGASAAAGPVGPGAGAALPAGATPVAYVAETDFNFGRIVRGATDSHDFIVQNRGGADLTLSVGATSCKCTVGNVSNRPIPPGGSAPVRLEWVAKAYAGPFRQTATIVTNDPDNSPITLTVSGEVTEVSGLEPKGFNLGDFNAGGPGVASVVFRSFGAAEVDVSAAVDEPIRRPELYSVDVAEVDDPAAIGDAAAAWRLTLRVAPGLPLGPVKGWVAIETSLPGYERFLVPVTGHVRGPISIRGRGWNDRLALLNIGPVESSVGVQKTLLLWCRGEEAASVEFAIAEVDPPELLAELGERQVKQGDPAEAASFTPLKLSLPPGTRSMVRMDRADSQQPAGAGDATIRLRTSHPSAPEIEFRVRFAVEG